MAGNVLEAHAAAQVQTVDDDLDLGLGIGVTTDAAGHDGVALVQQAQLAAVLVHHVADVVLVIVVDVDAEVLAGTEQVQDLFQVFLLAILFKEGPDFLGVQEACVLGVDAVDPPGVVVAGEVVVGLPLLGGIQADSAGLKIVADAHSGEAFLTQGDK